VSGGFFHRTGKASGTPQFTIDSGPQTVSITSCLVEHVTMTLRITLLVLVTGLFALIWTHDQPAPTTGPELAAKGDQPANIAMSQAEASWNARDSLAQWRNRDFLAKANRQLADAWVTSKKRLVQAGGEWMNDQAARTVPQIRQWLAARMTQPVSESNIPEMPLPAGIVPGEYRAVSNTGMVRHLFLTLDDLQPAANVPIEFVTRDVYESGDESLHWYFIRVQSQPSLAVPVIAERGRHILIPAVAERSPMPGIERQASQIIVQAGERLAARLMRLMRTGDADKKAPLRMSAEEGDKTRL
jgi:hypothetical protein